MAGAYGLAEVAGAAVEVVDVLVEGADEGGEDAGGLGLDLAAPRAPVRVRAPQVVCRLHGILQHGANPTSVHLSHSAAPRCATTAKIVMTTGPWAG